MRKISKYISYAEATRSQTAIRLGIDNKPNAEQEENMMYVASEIFDPCREFVGGPLFASSFFRSPKLNVAIGGSETSDHVNGAAIDIDCDYFQNGNNRDLFFFIMATQDFDQLIWEFGNDDQPAWVHVSKRRDGNNRKQVLQAYRGRNGRTKYKLFPL